MKRTFLNRRDFIKTTVTGTIMVTPYLHVSLLKRWRKIGGDRVHLWPDVMPRSQSAASYARNAKKYYEAGADGLCFWDGERRTARISEWAAAQRLGHTQQLDRIIAEGPSYYRAVDLKYLGGSMSNCLSKMDKRGSGQRWTNLLTLSLK